MQEPVFLGPVQAREAKSEDPDWKKKTKPGEIQKGNIFADHQPLHDGTVNVKRTPFMITLSTEKH